MKTLESYNDEISKLDSAEKQCLFVQKYLFHGIPYVFGDDEGRYFDFRNRIAQHFNIGFHEVFIVGSAKLGFSPYKNTEFSFNSDIDVVLVNEDLFENYYQKISEYQYQFDDAKSVVRENEVLMYNEFLRYLVKGWMRPDKLPFSFQIKLLKDEWFEFFRSISNGNSEVGNYGVKAGLFKNYRYLEKYYAKGISDYYKKINYYGKTNSLNPEQ